MHPHIIVFFLCCHFLTTRTIDPTIGRCEITDNPLEEYTEWTHAIAQTRGEETNHKENNAPSENTLDVIQSSASDLDTKTQQTSIGSSSPPLQDQPTQESESDSYQIYFESLEGFSHSGHFYHDTTCPDTLSNNINNKMASDPVDLVPPVDDDILSVKEWHSQILSKVLNGEEESQNEAEVTPECPPPQDRYNFASEECGAKIVKTNVGAKDSTSILSENKDRYMLNLCSTDKWFIIELCEEARVKWISMATYEFFSSAFKDFTVSGSDVYPAKNWVEFQNFTAKNVRDMQWFKIDRPLVARYLKFELKSHYGTNYYCPVSVLRVYGSNTFEDIRTQMTKDGKDVQRIADILKNRHVREDSHNHIDVPQPYSKEERRTEDVSVGVEGLGQENNGTSLMEGNVSTEVAETSSSTHSAGKGHDNIFRTLANRIKALEINQSLYEEYMDRLATKYLASFKEFHGNQNKTRKELMELTQMVKVSITQTAQIIESLERRIQAEVHEQAEIINHEYSERLGYLHDTLESQGDMIRSLYIIIIVFIIAFIAIVFYEEARISQFLAGSRAEEFSFSPKMRNKAQVIVKTEEKEEKSENPSHYMVQSKIDRKRKKANIKRTKSMGQLLLREAPL
ncbi:hypothetical protein PROFUN_12788 [Planoprotostelium fungivorum]|uniref:SUN domain-containing protein n=1 Tax=Planoprotostelium fungivorum TaxID=1890364 RepID=A0A2P6N6H4_9EUKA|nr:hypothetical protein PROFUN_12788 [Planoprotostelium fungivorum]